MFWQVNVYIVKSIGASVSICWWAIIKIGLMILYVNILTGEAWCSPQLEEKTVCISRHQQPYKLDNTSISKIKHHSLPDKHSMRRVWIVLAWVAEDKMPKKRKRKHLINLIACLFPERMTWLLKIIHRLCCGQFYVRSIYFPPNYTASPCRRKSASTHEWETGLWCKYSWHPPWLVCNVSLVSSVSSPFYSKCAFPSTWRFREKRVFPWNYSQVSLWIIVRNQTSQDFWLRHCKI